MGKPQANRRIHIEILRSMTSEQRLRKAFEFTSMTRELTRAGIVRQHPAPAPDEIDRLTRDRILAVAQQDLLTYAIRTLDAAGIDYMVTGSIVSKEAIEMGGRSGTQAGAGGRRDAVRARGLNMRSFIALVVLALLGGCGVEEPGGDAGPQRSDSAGVEIVVSGAAGRFFDLEESLRIGVVTGEEPYQFDRIRGIDVAPDGRVLVGNGGTLSLRIYSPDGRFLVEMGGSGGGPGEFRFMTGGEFVGDSVVAVDHATATPRITLFHEDGDFGRTVSLDRRSTFGFGMVFTDSAWHVRLLDVPGTPASDGESVDAHWTVHGLDRTTGVVGPELHRYPGGRFVGMRGEFGFPPLFDPAPAAMPYREAGAILASSDSYELRLFGNDGSLDRIVRRVHTPTVISDDDLAHHRGEISEYYRQEGRSQESLAAALDRLPQPGVIPPIGSVMATDGGELWIRRQDYGADPLHRFLGPMAGEERAADPVLWDGVDADGSYRGSVWIPNNFQPRKWGRDWVIGVYEDDLEVQFVIRYELQGPVA